MLYAACKRVGTLAYVTVVPHHVPEAPYSLPKALTFFSVICWLCMSRSVQAVPQTPRPDSR